MDKAGFATTIGSGLSRLVGERFGPMSVIAIAVALAIMIVI
jgi:hypothetical protein